MTPAAAPLRSARTARTARTLAVLVAVVALPLLLSGCKSDQQKYCDAVKSDQTGLSKTLDAGGNDALLKALPVFEQLHDKAPEDIRDDWLTLIDALDDLQKALSAAGVDAATYDRTHPPAGVTAAQQKAIDSAAAELTNPATTAAFEAVQQEARDVCQTPLTV